jgi:hypothetical protein
MHCFHQESANEKKCCHQHATQMRQNEEWKTHFWTDKIVWRRSAINTLRCLTGCSIGDLSTMFYLSTFFSSMPTWAIMSLSMSAGIGTSLALETVALRITDKLSWKESFNLAWTMSLMSMLVMELTENIVDRSLTGGVVHLSGLPLPSSATSIYAHLQTHIYSLLTILIFLYRYPVCL